MTETRSSQWIGDAAGTLTMIWERFFGDVADVPVVSPTPQSRLEKFNSVQLLIMSLMHRRHVPVDAGMSPSLTTMWKPDQTENACTCHNNFTSSHKMKDILVATFSIPSNCVHSFSALIGQ